MGTPISVLGNMHTCPKVEFLRPHVGGPIIGPGVSGVFIDGKPVSVVDDQCLCVGGSKPDKVTSGCEGVLVDGKPVTWQGSETEHGGVISEGVPGVTISGGFTVKADNPEQLEPRIFNLRWMKDDKMIRSDFLQEEVKFKASVVGIEDGDEVEVKIQNDKGEFIIDTKAVVQKGEIEVDLTVDNEHFNKDEDTE